MRIIAGKYKSRLLTSLEGDTTRPTLDKIKEAVFSRIGPYFEAGWVLDLFAGSGSVGLECLSRGMSHAIFADSSYPAIQVIKKNIETLALQDQSEVLRSDYKQTLQLCVQNKWSFDYIYLDPPYLKQRNTEIMEFIYEHNLLNQFGLIIIESLKEDVFPNQVGDIIKEKEAIYGKTKISYYRKEIKK